MNCKASRASVAAAIALACGVVAAPVAATTVLGGSSLLIDRPSAIDAGTLSILPSGFGNTGTLLFTNAMTLPNPISIFSGAIANMQTFGLDVALTGTISGAGALSKQLPGSLTLAGANTYSGGTTVSGGTLAVTNDAALGAGTLTLEGATLRGLASLTLANRLALSGSSVLAAARGTTLTLAGLSSVATGTTLQFGAQGDDGTVVLKHLGNLSLGDSSSISAQIVAGTLQLGTDPAGGALRRLGVQQGATLDLAGRELVTQLLGGEGRITSSAGASTLALAGGEFAGTIDGSLRVVAAAGSTRLTAASRYTGGTTIDVGSTLELFGDGAIAGAIDNNGVLEVNSPNIMTLDAPITGSGMLRKLGLGRLTLAAANTFAGGLEVNRGMMVLGPGALPGTGLIDLANTELRVAGDLVLHNDLNVSADSTISVARGRTLNWTFNRLHPDTRARLRFGSPDADGTVAFDLVRVGNLGIDLVAGTLQNGGQPIPGNDVILSDFNIERGGTFDVDGQATTLLNLTGAGRIANTGKLVRVRINDGDFAGTIDGPVALSITGPDVTLRGTNTHGGGTEVSATATLGLAQGASLIGDLTILGQVAQDAGATLELRDLQISSPGASPARMFQFGGTTTVHGRFALGTTGRGLYVLQNGSLALRAASVETGVNAQGAFDWRRGHLRFLDDYTLTAGSALLGPALELDHTRSLQARKLTLANDASVTLLNSTLEVDETLHNAGKLRMQGTLKAATVVNEGEIHLTAGASELRADVVNAGGSIAIAQQGVVTFEGDFTNNGTLDLDLGASATFKGRVSGAGAFTGAGKSTYEAEFHVGNSPARVVLEGKQVFTSTSVIDMDLAGTTGPGDCASCYAQLVFDGLVEIEGATLKVNLIDDYAPRGGERYTLFVFNAPLSGGFGNVLLPKLLGGLQWDTSALMTLGELRVSAVPLPGAVWGFLPAMALLATRRRAQAKATASG